jgi:hypothetical protein
VGFEPTRAVKPGGFQDRCNTIMRALLEPL